MAAKIPTAQRRLFHNVFFCKVCKQKMRLDPGKVLSGKVACRKCKSKAFRAIKKK
jgi:hypothetical protein